MNVLTQWHNAYTHVKHYGLAIALCRADWVDYTAHDLYDLAKRLVNLDTETLTALKKLMERPHPSAVAHGVVALIRGNEYQANKLFIRHYDERINYAEWSSMNNAAPYWIQTVAVGHFKLPDWNLPIAQESEIFGVLKTIDDAHIEVGDWLVECLVKHRGKTDRIIELLRQRYVATLDDMEALLSDEVPASLSQGAL